MPTGTELNDIIGLHETKVKTEFLEKPENKS